MLDPVKFIQDNILRDASAVVTAKLTQLFYGVLEEIYNYHDWKCLRREDSLDLVVGTMEYELSGADQDLQKIMGIFYGEYLFPLPDYSETEFRRSVYGQITNTGPACYVPLEKTDEYTWKVWIYPTDELISDPAPYYTYKKKSHPSDVALYPNGMVFVNGVLSLYLTGVATTIKDSRQAIKMAQLARDYLKEYKEGREKMKQEDEAVVHPRRKMVISDERKRSIRKMRVMNAKRGR